MPAPNTRIVVPNEPVENHRAFDHIAEQASKTVGYVFLTILAWDRLDSSLTRVYSTDQAAYPTGGSKFMPLDAPWPQAVIVQKQVHVCWNIKDMAETYTDVASIVELGAGSCVCIPVIVDGETVGTLNFMGQEGAYGEASVRAMKNLATSSVEAFSTLPLAFRRLHTNTGLEVNRVSTS